MCLMCFYCILNCFFSFFYPLLLFYSFYVFLLSEVTLDIMKFAELKFTLEKWHKGECFFIFKFNSLKISNYQVYQVIDIC